MGYQYLGWDKPFSLLFANRLLQEGGVEGSIDEWLIWVPSSRAGRHVLNELFKGEEDAAEAFHPPRFETPSRFVQTLLEGTDGADELQRLFAWKSVLRSAHPSDISAIFPVVPESGRDQWAYAIARQLLLLRQKLTEEGWTLSAVAKEPLALDHDRWTALAGLERKYLAWLRGKGFEDPDILFDDAVADFAAASPYKRILVAGVLNLSQRQISVLKYLSSRGIRVDHYLPLPESMADSMDEWGRPISGVWDKQPIPGELLQEKIQRAGEPRELVDKVLDLADVYRINVDALVLGSPVAEIGDYAIERSKLTETRFYAPTGIPLWETCLGRFLRLIRDFGHSCQLPVFQELLLHHQFRNWAHSQETRVDWIEKCLFEIRQKHLVGDANALRDPTLAPSGRIQAVREFIELTESVYLKRNARDEGFPEWIWRILQTVSNAERNSSETNGLLVQFEDLLQRLRASMGPQSVSEDDYWELLIHQLQSEHFYPERDADERPVSGWLELPWERAPHMVILGLPDTEVPGTGTADPFLTPALCKQLQIYGMEEEAAFHAFRLRMLLESRKEWGKLDILLPDRGLEDDPMTPSRFLFQSKEEEIIDRVNLLLGERNSRENMYPSTFGGTINLPEPVIPDRMHVTSFSAYLANPFRFYLERLNRWAVPEALPVEMDALDFGSLAHDVMESLNGTDEGRSLAETNDVVSYLLDQLGDHVRARFGSRLSVPVRIQLGAMQERLKAVAEVISNERNAGWEPVKVEWAVHEEVEILVGGLPLHGRIDLLERNSDSGLYRIVDYKTSDKAVDPFKVHLSRHREGGRIPVLPECVFESGNATFRWKDLQLPLYQVSVERVFGVEASCAYVSLAKAVKDIRLLEWTPGETERSAALKCAEAIVESIRQGYFPVEGESRYDDPWLPWFGGDYLTGLNPQWVTAHTEEVK
ncbi:MAG: PD-(D/E)XK nuclease family protein [Puniceicoccaceae bacterium]